MARTHPSPGSRPRLINHQANGKCHWGWWWLQYTMIVIFIFMFILIISYHYHYSIIITSIIECHLFITIRTIMILIIQMPKKTQRTATPKDLSARTSQDRSFQTGPCFGVPTDPKMGLGWGPWLIREVNKRFYSWDNQNVIISWYESTHQWQSQVIFGTLFSKKNEVFLTLHGKKNRPTEKSWRRPTWGMHPMKIHDISQFHIVSHVSSVKSPGARDWGIVSQDLHRTLTDLTYPYLSSLYYDWSLGQIHTSKNALFPH